MATVAEVAPLTADPAQWQTRASRKVMRRWRCDSSRPGALIFEPPACPVGTTPYESEQVAAGMDAVGPAMDSTSGLLRFPAPLPWRAVAIRSSNPGRPKALPPRDASTSASGARLAYPTSTLGCRLYVGRVVAALGRDPRPNGLSEKAASGDPSKKLSIPANRPARRSLFIVPALWGTWPAQARDNSCLTSL